VAVKAGEQVPAETTVAYEGFGARQRGPRTWRAEIVTQIPAQARRTAEVRIDRDVPHRGPDPRNDIAFEVGIFQQCPPADAPATLECQIKGRFVVQLIGPSKRLGRTDQAMEVVLDEFAPRGRSNQAEVELQAIEPSRLLFAGLGVLTL